MVRIRILESPHTRPSATTPSRVTRHPPPNGPQVFSLLYESLGNNEGGSGLNSGLNGSSTGGWVGPGKHSGGSGGGAERRLGGGGGGGGGRAPAYAPAEVM